MTFFWGILGLGFIVFIHELGHFLASTISGVKVEAFSIGMGPVLLHKKIREVDFRISLVPLGGYCAMKGEKDIFAEPEARPRDSFYGTHPLKRLFIAFAGPFFNLVLGFICFTSLSFIGYTYYSAGTAVIMLNELFPERRSVAAEAGMKTGDRIISINGSNMEDFSDIARFISTHGGEELEFTVDRNGETVRMLICAELDKETGSGKIGIASDPESVRLVEKKAGNLAEGIKEGYAQTRDMLSLSVKGLLLLFRGVDLRKSLSGPARITSMLGETMQEGFRESFRTGLSSTLEFIALISLSLFMTNLLPVPVLDGGLIVFAAIEAVSGKRVPSKIQVKIQYIGLALIVVLMLLSLSNDFFYFMGRQK